MAIAAQRSRRSHHWCDGDPGQLMQACSDELRDGAQAAVAENNRLAGAGSTPRSCAPRRAALIYGDRSWIVPTCVR
jgi:hypothetical protein